MDDGMNEICLKLAQRLRNLRKQKGWTQIQLADFAGISAPVLISLERGVKLGHMRTLHKLALALDTTLSDLLTGI